MQDSEVFGRLFIAKDFQVRLLDRRLVKPFVRGLRNDTFNVEAIVDTASPPTMRFVPAKSTEQQDPQAIHRAGSWLVDQRTSLINHPRGPIAEYGLIFPTGTTLFKRRARESIANTDQSQIALETFGALLDELRRSRGESTVWMHSCSPFAVRTKSAVCF